MQKVEAYKGKTFLSALTKAFWMMKRHPVVIYDSNARRGLRRYGFPSGENNYSIYFDSWFKFFDSAETKRNLDDAVTWLAKKSPYAQDVLKRKSISLKELHELTGSDWFRNRVADMHLFYAAD
jgi:phage terminase small subunit